MLRFILIVILLAYVFYKVGTVIMRMVAGSAGANRNDRTFSGQQQRKKPPEGNVNIDYVPGKDRKGKGYDGGEYVDYEEVK